MERSPDWLNQPGFARYWQLIRVTDFWALMTYQSPFG